MSVVCLSLYGHHVLLDKKCEKTRTDPPPTAMRQRTWSRHFDIRRDLRGGNVRVFETKILLVLNLQLCFIITILWLPKNKYRIEEMQAYLTQKVNYK